MDLRRRFDAATCLDARSATEPLTMFFGVPTMYVRLLAGARARRGCGRRRCGCYVSGSAPLSPQIFAELQARLGQTILERYGMTETIMNTTNPYDGERRPGTVGHAVPAAGGACRRTCGRAQPLPDGETGEIEVRGPHVFAGYWQRPDATAEAFDADGWFHTGDLGRRGHGRLLHDQPAARKRADHQRRLQHLPARGGGSARRIPGVAEVAVLGLPDPDFGEQVVAVVVRDEPALTAEQARRLLPRPARELQEAAHGSISTEPCPATPSARCRSICCASNLHGRDL